ncbi:flagellar hook-associated protein 2 [Virgibacillus natechei]|uniref:Flagellar hook-associated protein 2 n=1 Tax=Virgibacillus natechei TaxID=1216297 RepID=A0ABS4IKU3_9BACI|nr:flagellar hook-associated protein 2 [Virgibacillus natechei]MBP1971165.1 flagellar hook-associated protein 2 [Virgibacillus natechei]UZD11912.1 flagellar hook-associated protein 2 [Virgibacillus natechei]
MRVGGLVSGMDTDSMVDDLMAAERIPLNKMEQDKTMLEWERDGFRDINKSLLELDNMLSDMKYSRTYNSKTVNSTQEDAVTATGNADSPEGSYNINVTQLATSAMNVTQGELDIKADEPLVGQGSVDEERTVEFDTFNEDGEKIKPSHSYDINEGDTLNDVLAKITNDEDNHVRAFYDEQSNRVFMETTRTGSYNNGEIEIDGDGEIIEPEIYFKKDSFLDNELKMDIGEETGGKNAVFEYNEFEIESKDNNYTLNGINFEFKSETEGNATLTVDNDTDAAFDSIMEFIDQYNEVVDTLNGTQQEERNRDYPPLTEAQKNEMTENEIELWEEQAMSGILKGESSITNGLFSMRQSWYSNVETDGDITSITQIGITTSANYLDGGKLEVDEDTLRSALEENPNEVQKLFSNSEDDESRGLVNRLEDSIEQTMGRIEERAGKGTDTLENYTIGKNLKDLDDRISAFEDRLTRTETRYLNEFAAMEQAISRMNQQSTMLMDQFGGQ